MPRKLLTSRLIRLVGMVRPGTFVFVWFGFRCKRQITSHSKRRPRSSSVTCLFLGSFNNRRSFSLVNKFDEVIPRIVSKYASSTRAVIEVSERTFFSMYVRQFAVIITWIFLQPIQCKVTFEGTNLQSLSIF